MATKVTTHLVDDISGEAADETVTFSFEGIEYEIDLAAHRAHHLRSALADYVANGRKRTGAKSAAGRLRASAASRPAGTSRVPREQTNAVREWARRNGYTVQDRGRIPGNVQAAFDQAHAGAAAEPSVESSALPSPVFSG